MALTDQTWAKNIEPVRDCSTERNTHCISEAEESLVDSRDKRGHAPNQSHGVMEQGKPTSSAPALGEALHVEVRQPRGLTLIARGNDSDHLVRP